MSELKLSEECPDPTCCAEAPRIMERRQRAIKGTSQFRETTRYYYECSTCGLEFTTAASRAVDAAIDIAAGADDLTEST
jgi:hypothetical protein